MTNSTAPTFFGRERELAWLHAHFDTVANRADDGGFSGPRMAVVLADTGYGKSRLVQQLFVRLAADEAWDPSAARYWPAAFLDARAQGRVNPDMSGHTPAGPPRFLWLGVRWQATDQGEGARRCALPALRHELSLHAGILERHQEAMRSVLARTMRASQAHGVDDPTAEAVGEVLSFGGLGARPEDEEREESVARRSEVRELDAPADGRARGIADDLLESLDALLHGAHAIPAVLWLDDAQWIDPETLRFLNRLWERAQERRWPLLIVVTHWERDWRRLARKGAEEKEATLAAFAGRAGVSLLRLEDGQDSDLRACLLARLPGLTPAQQDLLVFQANGNFQTMIENVGDLRSEARNFVDGDAGGPLSRKGEEFAASWETERDKRVEQRFLALAPQVKDLLGWSSRLGVRFLHDVVTDFAVRVARQTDAASDFAWCADLGAILDSPNPLTREFRDKAFHVVAARHFREHGKPYEAALSAALRAHLVQWISASFDADGGIAWPEEEDGAAVLAADSAVALLAAGQHAELRDLLDMARRELPRPERPDWNDPEAATWLRVLRLAAQNDAAENLWDRVLDVGKALEHVRWEDVPLSVVGAAGRDRLADRLETSGALPTATRMRRAELARNRARVREESTPEARDALSQSLRQSGRLAETREDWKSAQACYEEALAIDRALFEEIGTADEFRAVAISLMDLGDVLRVQGDHATASVQYEEALSMFVELQEELETVESARDVSQVLHRLGRVAMAQNDLDKAKELYTDSLEIDRGLVAEFGEAVDRRDVLISLQSLSDIAQREGDLKTARGLADEALALARGLCLEVGTPVSQDDVMTLAITLGELAEGQGELAAAEAHATEALEVARALHDRLGTPDSRRSVARCLETLGIAARRRGDLDRALALQTEALGIDRALALESGTPDSRHNLAVSLGELGEVAAAQGDLETARDLYAQALAIARGLVGDAATTERRNVVGTLLFAMGELALREGDLAKARACYGEAFERNQQEYREAPSLSSCNQYVWAAVCVGRCLLQTNSQDEVLSLLAPLRSEVDRLAKADQEREFVDTAAAYWETIAAAAAGLGREEEAGVARELATPLRARVVELDG